MLRVFEHRAGQNDFQEQKEKTRVLFCLACYGGDHILRRRGVMFRQCGLGMPVCECVCVCGGGSFGGRFCGVLAKGWARPM